MYDTYWHLSITYGAHQSSLDDTPPAQTLHPTSETAATVINEHPGYIYRERRFGVRPMMALLALCKLEYPFKASVRQIISLLSGTSIHSLKRALAGNRSDPLMFIWRTTRPLGDFSWVARRSDRLYDQR